MSGNGTTFVRRRGTTAVPNATVWDDKLSYGALGLLTVILSSPARKGGNGYRAYMKRGAGQAVVLRLLGELNAAGYRHQFKRREGGKMITDTIISETPLSADEAAKWHAEQLAKKTPTKREKPTHGGDPDRALVNRALKTHASSVPEDQVSLTSYLSKETVDSKKAEPQLAECSSCNRWRTTDNLTASGVCIDCLPQPAAPRPSPVLGRSYQDFIRARNLAKDAREPVPSNFDEWLATRPVPAAENNPMTAASA